MKLLFVTNVPSPYRVLFFNELGKLCDLTVIYQKNSSTERNNKWKEKIGDNYSSIFLKGISTGVDKAFCPEIVKYLKKDYDAIVICGISSPTEILAIEWCKMFNRQYCIEGDGAFINSENKFKYALKRHLISKSKICFSTCREHDKYYLHYGVKKSCIKRYRFSSLLEIDILPKLPTENEKECIRRKLNMTEKIVLLSVGRFIFCKGYDILLKAVKDFNEIGVYIVGDTPTNEYLEIIKQYGIKHVHFEGFKTKNELKDYYVAADFFVLPTRGDVWGLVVNEAMACGLPVITTNKCNAGLELIQNGYNGYIVNSEDVEDLKKAISIMKSSFSDLKDNSLSTIRNYTIESMVEDHIKILSNK